MKALKTLWQFARPHTIIGSCISITALYTMALGEYSFTSHWLLLSLSLICGICSNIVIVGINQVQDVDIDRINKPRLPMASGALSRRNALLIIYTCTFLAIFIASYISIILFGVIALSLCIGFAYSLPPFFLKKHHLPAALSITIVRGLLVNTGGFYVFTQYMHGRGYFTEYLWLLTGFIIAFSTVIAWYKDLPDMAGDKQYNIKTLAILYSPKFVFRCGAFLIITAYSITLIVLAANTISTVNYILLSGHAALLMAFLLHLMSAKLTDKECMSKFYKRFWWFFFAEYVLYFIAFIIQ